MKKWHEYLILVVALLPLLFINIKSSHDWGDDFAQYIHQAQNILNNIPQDETGYVFNENYFLGPQSYPVGFPIILAIVNLFSDGSIGAYNVCMSFFLFLFGVNVFMLFRRQFSIWTAFISTILIIYNPYFLNFKTEILSDLPFAVIVLLVINLSFLPKNITNSLMIGLLIAFSIHIRSAGFALLLAYLLVEFLNSPKQFIKQKTTLVFGTSFLVLFLLLRFVFSCNSSYAFDYDVNAIWFNGNDHLSDNLDKLLLFFQIEKEHYYKHIGFLMSAMFLAFSVLGLFADLVKGKLTILSVFVIIYFLMLFVFPHGNAGLRLLIPVIPILFYYSLIVLKNNVLNMNLPIVRVRFMAIAFVVLMSFSYYKSVAILISNQSAIVDGPYLPEAQQLFTEIKTKVTDTEVVAFYKPRALALYTNKKSVALSPDAGYTAIRKELKKFDVSFIAIDLNEGPKAEEYYLTSDTTVCKELYKNSRFKLYKVINTNF